MSPVITKAILLRRNNYGEADRILTCLTQDAGKISLIAKGVRKQKSKLAGGIELFSELQISFIRGRGDIGTLISARLHQNFGNIVTSLERTNQAYEVLKIINKTVEESAGEDWYLLTKNTLKSLNNQEIPNDLTQLWFNLQWLKLSGHSPNLLTDSAGKQLSDASQFLFDTDKMSFFAKAEAKFTSDHIKLLRLGLAINDPAKLANIQKLESLLPATLGLSKTMLEQFVSV